MKKAVPCLAIVRPSFYEQMVGGSEYQAYLLAERAQTAGIAVHFIFVDNGRPCKNNLGVELHPLRRIPFRKTLGAPWSLYWPGVSRNLKWISPDVVYVRGGYSWAAMTAWYAKQNGCCSVWHIASSMDVTPPSLISLLKRPFDLVETKAIKYAIHHSTHVVSHARFLDDLLKKHYGRASEVILKEQPEPTESLDKRAVCTVVWVANIKSLKQPEMFIRLARELIEYKNLKFIMIGRAASGEYQTNLENELRSLKNVEYLGEQPIEKVNSILAESHVFVNTSIYEGLPNTFVQAWMREVPVISMLLDPDDILKAQDIGYCSGSFDQMVRDVKKLVDNPNLRDEMGKRARNYALNNHSLETNMTKLLNLMYPDLSKH